MIHPDAFNENTGENIEPPGLEEATSSELGALRAGIDSVDEEIVRLLDRRARLARRVGEIKQKNGLEAYAPAREREVLNRVTALSAGDFQVGEPAGAFVAEEVARRAARQADGRGPQRVVGRRHEH